MTFPKSFSKVRLIVAVIIISIFLGALTDALVLQYGWNCSPGLIIAYQVLSLWGHGPGITMALKVVAMGFAIDSAIWFALISGAAMILIRRRRKAKNASPDATQ